MKQLSIELFRDCCALNFSVRRWSNRKTVKVSEAEAAIQKTDKKRTRKTVKLTASKVYDEIVTFQNETKKYVVGRSMPSFFKSGIFLVRLTEYKMIDAYLAGRNATLINELVPRMVEDMSSIEYLDRQELGDLYDPNDYPISSEMPAKFGFIWLPISFGVPDNLPQELYDAAKKKTEEIWSDAREKVLMSLRMGMAKLVDHAIEKLKVKPGEKAKTFQYSTISNIKEFLETFQARNILNDEELASIVAKAEKVMADVDDPEAFSEMLRGDDKMRERMAEQFDSLKSDIDSMITVRPSRKFIVDDVDSD